MGGQVLELESERLRREGKTEGKAEGAKIAILDLLEDYEPLPDSLKEFIFNENSSDTLRRWLKLAAKATSLEDFKSKIGA